MKKATKLVPSQKFRVADIVKIVSVSGHSDLSNVVGTIGVVDAIAERGNGPNQEYKIHVNYVFPIKCACPKTGCNLWFSRDWFKEEELILHDVQAVKEMKKEE